MSSWRTDRPFQKNTSGSAIIQYGLVAGVLAVAVAGSGQGLKSSLRDTLGQIGLALIEFTEPLATDRRSPTNTGPDTTGGQG